MEDLARELNAMCDEKGFDTYWYVKDLRTGDSADRNGHTVIPSASTRKIGIMMEAFRQINAGKLSLDDPFVVEEKYQNHDSGCFQNLKPGFTVTLYDAIVMMIIVSDNTCTGKIGDIVGMDNVNELCRSIGMTGTTHRWSLPPYDIPFDHPVEASNATTAADMGILLEQIVKGASDEAEAAKMGCTSEQCQMAIQIMQWQKFREKLPALLPVRAKVAHKTGTGIRNCNDTGIVFDGDEPRYVLSVYIDGIPRYQQDGPDGHAAGNTHAAKISRACWDYIVAEDD